MHKSWIVSSSFDVSLVKISIHKNIIHTYTGLEYDPVRGRYFPPAAGRRRATPSPQHVPATSVTAPAFSGAASFSPPSQNVASRILSRRQGHNLRGRDRDILRMGEVGRLFHLHQQWVDRKSGLEDVDFQGNQLVTGSRNGLVQLLLVEEGEGNRSGQMIVVDLMSRPTAIARVRWRKSGGSVGPGNIVAVAEVGGGEGGRGGGATAGVTVCKILGLPPSEEEVSFRMDRFPLGQRDLWSVEWDPFHGRKLLPGLSKGPLVMLDVEAGRQVHHPFRLSSDCFASTWGNDDNSVLLGMRNGQVSMVDLRSPSPMVAAGWVRSPPLTTMGCIVDQVEMLPDGRGVLASDRLGTLRLLDLRYFGRALYDFPPPPSLSPTLASTGFVLDPVDQTLCMTLTPEGVVRMFDLAHGRAFEEAAGSIAPRGPSLAQRTGSATPRRCFLARAWGGAGGGSHHQQSALWPSLFCGDRTTGDLFQINLQRDPS